MAELTKQADFRPTLVSTGMKCKLAEGTYLELSVRSSTPLKHWLILANGVGIIDADYYNNESNEGEIFLQMINLSPFNIMIKKGEAIGQGIIKPYLTTDNDVHGGKRNGGFGSTTIIQ
jgi:dUTP pyrophosphatase